MAKKKESRDLYFRLHDCVKQYMDEKKKNNETTFQSEIVGALEMVKCDWHLLVSGANILPNFFDKLKGKNIEVNQDGSLVITPIENARKHK